MKWLKRVGIAAAGLLLAVLYAYRTWPVCIYDANVDAAAYENVGELTQGAVVEQSFQCPQDGLKAVELTVSNLGYEVDASYRWTLREMESGSVVGQGTFLGTEIDNSKKAVFSFEEQEDSRGKEYVFTVETMECQSGHGITVMKTAAGNGGGGALEISGVQDRSVLVLTQDIRYLNIETGIVFFALYLYLILFMMFLTRLFK